VIDSPNHMTSVAMLSVLAARLIHIQSTRYSDESSSMQGVDTY